MNGALDPRVTPWIGATAAAAAVAIVWSAWCQPAVKATWQAVAEAQALSGEIAAVETMVLAAGGEAAWLATHEARQRALQARLPKQEQVSGLLNAVDGVFRRGGLILRNVNQGNVEPALEQGVPLMIGPLVCYRLPILVSAEGRYHDVAEAIARLTDQGFPGLVSVERLQLRRIDDGPRIEATISLAVFVTGLPR